MNDVLVALISGFSGVLVALIGREAARQSSRAKKREEVVAQAQQREENAWERLERDIARMDEQATKQDDRIKLLEDGLRRSDARAEAAEQRAINAERERDRAFDKVYDYEQAIEAFIQDRLDLNQWVTDGGKPPVPDAHWRVVQVMDMRDKNKEGVVQRE